MELRPKFRTTRHLNFFYSYLLYMQSIALQRVTKLTTYVVNSLHSLHKAYVILQATLAYFSYYIAKILGYAY